ncbi:MAG: hypothetical protein M1347_04050 [Chloroflexi bacterium]|nr:hypothetical protein [Chloroflexota bacterium]
MKIKKIYQQLADKSITAEQLARKVIAKPALLPVLVDGLDEVKADVKYGCGKALRIVVDQEPALLYPYFDIFANMLEHRNKIMRWEAIYLIAGLASVDEEDKITAIWRDYFRPIEGPEMITAANIVNGAVSIAVARRELVEPAIREILRVRKGKYETEECYRVVAGAALKAFDKIYKLAPDKKLLVEFAELHAKSSRIPTRNAARRLLEKHARLSAVQVSS